MAPAWGRAGVSSGRDSRETGSSKGQGIVSKGQKRPFEKADVDQTRDNSGSRKQAAVNDYQT